MNGKKGMMKKVVLFVGMLFVALAFLACGGKKDSDGEKEATKKEESTSAGKSAAEKRRETTFFSDIEKDDTVILFTTDVHHKLTDYFGYDGLMAVKKKVWDIVSEEQTLLVDCGDCLNDGKLGEATKGMGIAQIMDYVGVDAAVPGNNDFEYGVAANIEIANTVKFQYLSCNLREKSTGSLVLKPYTILEKNGKKIGIVGVTTPNHPHSYEGCTDFAQGAISEEEAVYDFSEDCFYEQVQSAVDGARGEGAEYVILITHLGRNAKDGTGSVDVIENTRGIDGVIDGHAHIEIEMETHKNPDGKDVVLTSSGNWLKKVGKLVIKKDGSIVSGLLPLRAFLDKDSETTAYIEGLKNK